MGRKVSVRKVVSGFGRGLILSGVLILLFVAYQLWGTAWAEARAQDDLKEEFAAALAEAEPTTTTTERRATTTTTEPDVESTTTTSTTTTTAVPRQLPPPPEGAAIAIVRIPAIGVDKAVVEGVSVGDLKKGPGHYPSTPMPGQPGNAALAGHRTTYGAPFHRLDELEVGDDILVTTRQGSFRYEVAQAKVVSPGEIEVLDDFGDNRLTLTTCHPKYSARERLIVVGLLQDDPAPDDIDETLAPVDSDALPGEEVVDDEPRTATTVADTGDTISAAEGFGLSGEGAPNGPAIFWGLVAAAVLAAEWWLSRVWLKWPTYALVTPVFLVALFVFFENFSRLLPANV